MNFFKSNRQGIVLLRSICGLLFLLLAQSCASDDVVNNNPQPTVPQITAAPTSETPTTSVQQNGDGVSPSTTNSPNTQPPTTSAPKPVDGNVGNAMVSIEQVLTLDEPIAMAAPSDDSLVWIAQRGGQVLRVDLENGVVVDTIVDISAETVARGEQGLLGIAINEDWLFVNFTDLNGNTKVDAFGRNGIQLNGTRRTLLSQSQPFRNHNGGALVIGPDNHLYIGFGDGGSANDPLGAGQDLTTWLGSILRVKPTPSAQQPYEVPRDNPFVDQSSNNVGENSQAAPETFISGVRNPWRFSFDRQTGDLWIADVGQDRYEEVTVLLAANGGGSGANLGWNLREGLHEFRGAKPPNHVDPVWEYGQDQGCSVTGGFVYRGQAITELVGSYVFGDYCTSRLWAVQISSGEIVFRDLNINIFGGALASFGEDGAGELYTLSLNGPISKLVPG